MIYLKLAILVAVAVFAYLKGEQSVQVEWDAEKHAQQILAETTKRKQAETTVQVVTKYVDRVKVVREQGQTIIKEVTKYVPNDSCPLPAGFRVLHDAATDGSPAPAPGTIDEEASVPAEVATQTVVDNYTNCRLNTEQLEALQDWVLKQTR